MKIKFLPPLQLPAFAILLLLAITNASAQKKLVAVTQSALTGIALPEGSKHDGRFLMELSGKTLLELETKKVNTTVTKTEILYLPSTANPEEMVDRFTTAGWNIISVDGDDKFVWLQKDNRYVITYFSLGKKQHELYFGEVGNVPAITVAANTSNQQQQPNAQQHTDTQQPQQNNTQHQTETQQPQQPNQQQLLQNNNGTPQTGFAFSTTNFDDGWTSTVQEDWVEVTKNNLKVLLHYPKEGTVFPADPDVLTNAAWNILVAPRYSSLKNYKTAYISTFNRPYIGMGYANENSSGKDVFIVLYRQGQTGWLEFIAPDKNSFIQQYKFDPETIRWDSETDLLKPLEQMVSYNKFAVAATDFDGTWTSDFTGVQQLYNIYTGNYAGMNMHQSNQEFVFNNGSTYNWKLLVVSGMVGNAKFDQVKSSGTFSLLNNWQVGFSDIEGKPKKYHAFFSCIKGARLLHLLDADSPGSGIYDVYGKK